MIEFWGCSDDCIEIRGDFVDEIYGDDADLVLSTGLRAHIDYSNDGEWKIQVVHSPAGVVWALHLAGSEEAVNITKRDYTDVLVVSTPSEWAVLGKYIA